MQELGRKGRGAEKAEVRQCGLLGRSHRPLPGKLCPSPCSPTGSSWGTGRQVATGGMGTPGGTKEAAPTPTRLLCQTQPRDISSSLIRPVSQGRGFKVTQASTEELRTLLGSGRLLGPHGNGGSRPGVGLCRHQRRPEASLPGPTPHPPPQPSEKGLPPGLGPSKHPQP